MIFLPFALVPVIKKTWEKDALFLEYYSDYADPSIPTIDIGVPNTERGKCRQTPSDFLQLHAGIWETLTRRKVSVNILYMVEIRN